MKLATGLALVLTLSSGPIRAGAATATHAEPPDPRIYTAVRTEGLSHSQAMRFAGELADGIGARLMGSPNMRKAYDWSLATLFALGASNAHLEDIGEFGLSWRQNKTWMRMVAPDDTMFVAQAGPWSASSHGAVTAQAIAVVITNDSEMEQYRGKLHGKVVLLGPLRPVPTPFEAFAKRLTNEELTNGTATAGIERYYQTRTTHLAQMSERIAFAARRAAFLESENIAALVIPSRDGENGGGTGNLTVDNAEMPGRHPWIAPERVTFPVLYTAVENFGRVWRLLNANTAVSLQFELDSEVLGEHEHGYNVVAEIPGTDPLLKEQLVVVGAHLDSWGAGTGATDDGAGVAISLETLRILKAIHRAPRRTIRIVLYGGEEQGLLGSSAYAKRHLGELPRSTAADQLDIPVESWRMPAGLLRKGPEYSRLSAAYNIDAGGGRIRGVFTGGNPALAAIYRQWIEPLRDLGVAAVLDLPDWPADQSTYTQIGLPGIMFLQDPLDYDSRSHHSNMDTLERLVPEDLAQAAVVETLFVLNTADRSELLPRSP